MGERPPKPPDAFLSYTRFDDRHDGGAISEFCRRLASAVQAVTGTPFEIFQAVEGFGIGAHWPGKLDQMLNEARFLIPIVTPSYFTSKPCRQELERFLLAEAERERNDLVLPIYYIECDVLEDDDLRAADPMAEILHQRQRLDWRQLRFEPFEAREVRKELERLAREIVRARRRSMTAATTPQVGAESQISAARPEETPAVAPPRRAVAVPRGAETAAASIEIEYDGSGFSSQAAARWAVFFHTIGLEYEYKTEGYDLNGAWYLPDFWLPELGFWLEVRGGEATDEEKHLYQQLAEGSGRILLMAIGPPEPQDQIVIFSPSSSARFSFPQHEVARFYFADDRRNKGEFWLLSHSGAAVSIGPQTGPDHGRYPGIYGATRLGYEAAQSASFEHGKSRAAKPSVDKESAGEAMTGTTQIFLAHAREDKPQVRRLYADLKACGLDPWLDEVDLLPGQIWKVEIPKAIRHAGIFLACLSSRSVGKVGYVQNEFRLALSAFGERPPGSIYLVPVRLDDCEVPDLQIPDRGLGLRDIHWVDLWQEGGFDRLVSAIGHALGVATLPGASLEEAPTAIPAPEQVPERRAKREAHEQAKPAKAKPWAGSLPKPGTVFRDIDAPWCPELVVIPRGEFMMGSTEAERQWVVEQGVRRELVEPEKRQHWVRIGYSLAVGRYPVTFEEYGHFARITERAPPGDGGWGRGRRPVINVSWNDAKAYVAWLAAQTGQRYRLLSEAEWEYACRAGTTTRFWWGDEITPANANYGRNVGKTSEVGSYPANPFGLYDVHGNVWEWVEDRWHESYDGAPDDGSAWIAGDNSYRVPRGGSWDDVPEILRSAIRGRYFFDIRYDFIGFRVARTLSQSESVTPFVQIGRKVEREVPPLSFSEFARRLLIALSKTPGESLNIKEVAELRNLRYEKGWIARASEYLDTKGLISAKSRRHLQSGPDDDYYGVITGMGLAEAEKLQTDIT